MPRWCSIQRFWRLVELKTDNLIAQQTVFGAVYRKLAAVKPRQPPALRTDPQVTVAVLQHGQYLRLRQAIYSGIIS